MAHDFEIADEITLDATPEQVWEAIATGPGIDSWFMGHNEIDPGEGGTKILDLTDPMGVVQKSTITAWEPGRRLAFREDGTDGTVTAVEYVLEGRDGGRTRLRFVHNGSLDGADWEAYYDGVAVGDRMCLEQLAAYLKHFPGRHATRNLFLLGPVASDVERVWSAFATALSLTGAITHGASVRLNVPGLPATGGVVEFLDRPHYVGVRTPNGILVLMKGYQDAPVVLYHGFVDDENEKDIESAWRSWLASA